MVMALVLVLAAAPSALAEGTIFFMGGDDNVTTATFVIVNDFGQHDILSITKINSDTGPGLVIQKAKPKYPPLGCPDDAAKGGGNYKKIYVGGPRGYNPVIVQMADINGFNTSHQLQWEWEMYNCIAIVKAVPKK